MTDTLPIQSLDTPLDFPLYSGSAGAATNNVPAEFQVSLNGRGYIVDLSQYSRVTLPLRREPTDESVEPGEQSLNPNGVWKRSQDNWFLGAGQEYLDNRFAFISVYTHSGEDPSVRTRFWRSKGVDPFTEGKLSLCAEQVNKGSSSGTGQFVAAVGTYLYWWDGTNLKYTDSPGTGTPTWTTVTAPSGGWGTVSGHATNGNDLWIAAGSAGLLHTTAGTSSAPTNFVTSSTPDFVAYGNGWLLMGTGPVLASVSSAGSATTVWTHPNSSWKWNAGSGSPVCIYVAGSAGNVSEIYGLQTDSSGALGSPYMAGAVSAGELVRDIEYYDGIVGIATSLGVRTAQASDSQGHLTMGPVITDMGDCRCLSAWEAYLYCGWSNFDTNDGTYPTPTTQSGLGRLFLSEFTTDPLLPAYATDVMATDNTSGTVTSVAILSGVPWFCIDSSGVWGPSGNVVSEGWIEPGWVRYGLIQSKLVTDIDIRHDPLNGTVGLQIVPFGGSVVTLASSTVQSSTGPSQPITAGYVAGEAFMPIITLTRDSSDATKGPVLRRWTISAFPISPRQDQILVPIVMARQVQSPVRDGAFVSYDPLTEFQQLKFWESWEQLITYQEGAATYTCVIDQVELKPAKWADDFSFFEGLIMVSLITVD